MTAQRARLPGPRWHFSHGPIDLVIGAEGEAAAVQAAHEAAWQRFVEVLPELVGELALLRSAVGEHDPLAGPIARRMWAACRPYRHGFITPMAAVAGAVAEEIVGFYRRPGVRRAWVNNGGDIALHLVDGESVRVGLCADPERRDEALEGGFSVVAASPVRGIATSGWRGRSFSFGIADSVTVLARSAAAADAAATVIANAVDVDDARILRRPACELKDDSDLGERQVTVDVPPLEASRVTAAIGAGLQRARTLQAQNLVEEVAIVCQGRFARLRRDPAPSLDRQAVQPLRFGSVFA